MPFKLVCYTYIRMYIYYFTLSRPRRRFDLFERTENAMPYTRKL